MQTMRSPSVSFYVPFIRPSITRSSSPSILTRSSSADRKLPQERDPLTHKKIPAYTSNPSKSNFSPPMSTSATLKFTDFHPTARSHIEIPEKTQNLNFSRTQPVKPVEALLSSENSLPKEPKPVESSIEDYLAIELGIQKSVIRPGICGQTTPICATLNFKTPKQFKKTPVDLICIVGKNLSMNGKNLKTVKAAISSLMERMDENDRLSIIAYHADAEVVTDLLYMTPENKSKTVSAINLIQTDIGSNILGGLGLAFKALKARRTHNPSTGIYLLNDGSDRLNIEDVDLELSSQNIKEEFTIHTFGIGKYHDSELLSSIAGLKNGEYHYIADLGILNQAFLGGLGMLCSIVGFDGKLTFSPVQHSFFSENAELHRMRFHSVDWYKDQSSGEYRTILSQIHANETLNFVMELTVPPLKNPLNDLEKKIPIVNIEFEFKTLQGQVLKTTAEVEISLLNNRERCKKISFPNENVLKQYFRVKSSAVMLKACDKADIRDYEAAKEMLRDLKKEIQESHVTRDKYVKNLQADIDEAIENCFASDFQEDGKHRILSIARGIGAEKYCHFCNLEFTSTFRDEYQISDFYDKNRAL